MWTFAIYSQCKQSYSKNNTHPTLAGDFEIKAYFIYLQDFPIFHKLCSHVHDLSQFCGSSYIVIILHT